MSRIAIIRLRRDLRVADHAPLLEALANGYTPAPLYVHDPASAEGGAVRRWLHDALADLDTRLRRLGSRLILRTGDPHAEILRLVRETGAEAVYWHRRYDPAGIEADTALKAALKAEGVLATSFAGDCLHEPHTVATKTGTPFRVFTPFWRHCSALPTEPPASAPTALPAPPETIRSEPLEALRLKPDIPWDAGIAADWDMTRAGAEARLRGFFGARAGEPRPADRYESARDLPATDGTSRLSPYLHFGQVSPREVIAAARAAGGPGLARFGAEIGWREFGRHLLFHFPDTPRRPLDRGFEGFPWADAPELLVAWKRGRTGVPIVDAGMRQLRATGWMHNRVRMVAGSYLVKNLLLDWRAGADWFMDNLVDADLAQNTMGWQWVAGCGADAAPFFRVFNPVLQGEKFDADGEYVRRFVPELARLPARWIHKPWEAPRDVLSAAGVRLGENYPAPVVDLALNRARALTTHAALRGARRE